MRDVVEQFVRQCHNKSCQHDRASHYIDKVEGWKDGEWLKTELPMTCLCRGCVCKRYLVENDPWKSVFYHVPTNPGFGDL